MICSPRGSVPWHSQGPDRPGDLRSGSRHVQYPAGGLSGRPRAPTSLAELEPIRDREGETVPATFATPASPEVEEVEGMEDPQARW